MAIQDDYTIDYVNGKITYSTAFVNDRPPSIYTANEVYSFLAQIFNEPEQMDNPVPMSAQTPTQYTLLYPWFMDNESMKAIYGGSIQTSGWDHTTVPTDEGITALRYVSFTSEPEVGDLGKAVTGDSSGATGVILAIDAVRDIVWVRNTNATVFTTGEVVDDDTTGTDPDFTLEATNFALSGESIWINAFSVGSLQAASEVYIGQEDDQMGGQSFHAATARLQLNRRIEKIAEWWDSDVDFATGSPNLLGGAGHVDLLLLTQENGSLIDGGRFFAGARQSGKIYSHFEFVATAAGNYVIPFSSTGADLNSADGCYNCGYDAGSGTPLVGDIVEDGATGPVPGRLRLVITAVNGTTSGDMDFYLIGENEADGTLKQVIENGDMLVRTGSGFNFDIDLAGTALTNIGPGLANPGAGAITVTFGDAQRDVDEDTVDEQFACVIDCATNLLADVYKRMQFLTGRGNQDGTSTGVQDLLLPMEPATAADEAGEFYRAVGDIVFDWDANAGTSITEGDMVDGSISGATGLVVSATVSGATGTAVLTQVKGGPFVDNDIVGDPSGGANTVTIEDGTISTLADKTDAPFGAFAGGRWFVAQGVVLDNVPEADANNWQTVDLAGVVRAPPTTRTIIFAGLAANVRASIFEVTTAGDDDIVKGTVGVTSGAQYASAIVLDANVAQDVPSTGWIRVVDVSDAAKGTEFRLEYSSYSLATVTLRDISAYDATADAGGDTTTLVKAGAFTNFGADGEPKIGMIVSNTTNAGEWSRVIRKIDANSLEVSLSPGSVTWASKVYEFNTIPILLAGTDTCYFPYVDDVSTGASISKNIKFDGITEIVARARFSDFDTDPTGRLLPFEQLGQQITDANLTITAISNADTIAASS